MELLLSAGLVILGLLSPYLCHSINQCLKDKPTSLFSNIDQRIIDSVNSVCISSLLNSLLEILSLNNITVSYNVAIVWSSAISFTFNFATNSLVWVTFLRFLLVTNCTTFDLDDNKVIWTTRAVSFAVASAGIAIPVFSGSSFMITDLIYDGPSKSEASMLTLNIMKVTEISIAIILQGCIMLKKLNIELEARKEARNFCLTVVGVISTLILVGYTSKYLTKRHDLGWNLGITTMIYVVVPLLYILGSKRQRQHLMRKSTIGQGIQTVSSIKLNSIHPQEKIIELGVM